MVLGTHPWFTSLLSGLADVFAFFRDFFGVLPMAVQALIYFTFGSVLLICIVHMFRGK